MILSEKHQMMRKLYRQFAETEFTPELLDHLEETGEFNWDMHNKMAKYGFMVEEFARVSPVLSIYANTSNSLGAGPLLFCGTEEQKQKYVVPVAKGEKILAFALTEPGAGSDAGGTQTTAVEDGDFYILNGRKTFISGAPMADYCVVYAKTDPTQKGSRGISMFIVDMKLPGVSCGKPEHKMGIIGYPTSDVILENVRVHKSDLLGPLHKGFATAMKTLDGGRLGMSAQALGIAQGCLEESIKYAKERKQFGQPIAKFQAISFMIAEMATEIEGHPDNVAPAIFGGFTVSTTKGHHVESFSFLPKLRLRFVVAVPDFYLPTKKAREVLPETVPMADASFNIGRASMLVAALMKGSEHFLKRSFDDALHQPYRAALIPGMFDVFRAARAAGALGTVLSGAGPCLIAFTLERAGKEEAIGAAMREAFHRHGVEAEIKQLALDTRGAHIVNHAEHA